METKPTPTSFHHQRAPRTPESYFNVPESIALLNIVKSERIQSAFQSNRKNHASVWEMVAEILNRFSPRKRSAKQCCNRYENLKKIYTQLKKNPERHVRRNWPYMFLFKEIEENRGECWGSNSKRLTLIAKNHKNLAYFHRRRPIDDFGGLLLNNKDSQGSATTTTVAQHNLLQSLMQTASDTNNESSGNKLTNFLANNFVETQLAENAGLSTSDAINRNNLTGLSVFSPAALQLQIATASAAAGINNSNNNKPLDNKDHESTGNNPVPNSPAPSTAIHDLEIQPTNVNDKEQSCDNKCEGFLEHETKEVELLKKCQQRTHNILGCENNISMKSEPMSEGEFNPDDIQLMQINYNGAQGYYANNMDHNILHPDVIVDTDNLSDCSSTTSRTIKGKRKLSTSTDGADSTNFELIEYLKRREKRDEELLTRMDLREERLLNLLERTVVAIETLAQSNCKTFRS